jgi:hypothetical protein
MEVYHRQGASFGKDYRRVLRAFSTSFTTDVSGVTSSIGF